MAATSPLAGDRGDVDADVRAQADLARRPAIVGLVANHRGDLSSLQRSDVVDDPLRERVAGSRRLVVGCADVGDGETAVVELFDPLDGSSKEAELLGRNPLVEAPVDVVDVDPRLDEVRRHTMGARSGVLV